MPFDPKEIIATFLTDSAKRIIGWVFGSSIFVGLCLKFKSFLLTPVSIKPFYLLPVIIFAVFLPYIIKRKIKKGEYNIPIKSKYSNDSEPNELGRKTKWNYKKIKEYYYIPLLSHGYDSVHFVDFCGPWCSVCNHIVHVQLHTYRKPKFFCINCSKKYSVPSELLGSYKQKLFEYFKAEYLQGHLRQSEL